MKRKLLLACVAVLTLFFAGCASKEPLDYLPDCSLYIALNGEQIRNQAGARKVLDLLHKMEPASLDVDEKLERVYIGVNGGAAGSVYGVVMGKDGLAEKMMSQMRAQGGQDTKVEGRKSVLSGRMYMTPVNSSSVLFYGVPFDLQLMINTSKRKNPAAVNSSLFQMTRKMDTTHALVLTAQPAPIVGMASPQLSALSLVQPKGVAALREIKLISATVDWDREPDIKGVLHISSAEQRNDLAEMVNTLMQTVRARAGGASGNLLRALKVQPGEEGLSLNISFGKEDADAFLDKMEKSITALPQDERQRAVAIKQMLNQQTK